LLSQSSDHLLAIGCYTAGVPIKDMVVVDGGMAHHPEGAYYFRKDRKWIKAGETPQDVIDASLRLATAPEQPIEEKSKLWHVAPCAGWKAII
jgi:hypothetical protein